MTYRLNNRLQTPFRVGAEDLVLEAQQVEDMVASYSAQVSDDEEDGAEYAA